MSNITTTASQDMFDQMEKAYKFASIMSKSDIIPVHYRNKPENCFIAISTAYRLNVDPMLAMQNTFVVSGKLGMNTSFAISLLNQSGVIKGSIKYAISGAGDAMEVTASARLAKTDEEISTSVSMKMAIAEGWTRNNKYKTMPEHMLKYRAATFLIRLHFPEVLNGLHTVEELEDVKASETRDITPPTTSYNTKSEKLADKLVSIVLEDEQTPSLDREQLIAQLTSLVTNDAIDEGLNKLCEKYGLSSILDMDIEQLGKAIEWAKSKQ